MEISLGARLALLGFCVLSVAGLFFYYYLESRARRRKAASKESLQSENKGR